MRIKGTPRWLAGGVLLTAVVAAALIVALAGGGGSGHVNSTSLFPGIPATQSYDLSTDACPLAPRNRYLPAWSGCVTARVADISGSGRRDLILIYSRLSPRSLSGLPVRRRGQRQAAKLYPAERAMLRVVSPTGRVTTTRIYLGEPRGTVAALISIAHVADGPGKEIFLQVAEISSGSTALAYGLYHGRLVSDGPVLGYGGDSATQTGFQCLAGHPPRLVQHAFQLIRGIRVVHGTIYGWWKATSVTYAWHGPRLVKIAQSTLKRRVLPTHAVGTGCIKGIG